MKIAIKDIRKITLNPGEKLLIEAPEKLPRRATLEVAETFARFLGKDKVLIYPTGFKLRRISIRGGSKTQIT